MFVVVWMKLVKGRYLQSDVHSKFEFEIYRPHHIGPGLGRERGDRLI